MANTQLLDAELLSRARKIVRESSECVRTPLLKNVEKLGLVEVPDGVQVHLKLENMQLTGSFKSRGVVTQMAFASDEVTSGRRQLVTMSAGNYGKAFATACKNRGLKGNVVMPVTVPDSRQKLIESMGCNVIRVPTTDLATTVDKMVNEGMTYMHSFDDLNLMAGYGSVAEEITDEVEPDIVLVCCGGGGLVTGIATSLKLRGFEKCRIYGVEPETANTMQLSFERGEAASLPTVRSIAAGLAPPFAGTQCYKYASQHLAAILTLSDAEIATATKALYQRGVLAEPSGAAAFGALKFGKVPDLFGTVVVVVTGGNVTPREMSKVFEQFAL